MKKTQSDFILELLNKKSLPIPLKERIFYLISLELKKNLVNDDILNRIELLEKEFESLNNMHEVPKIKDDNPSPKISLAPNPENTKYFLSYFRDSDGLKYLTHDFKDPSNPPSRKVLLDVCKSDFEKAVELFPNIRDGLLRRIEEFAFKENPKWFIRKGDKKIEITEGWSSKNFIEWFDNQDINDVKHPCKNSKWNKLIIEPFKKSIQIREGILLDVINENIDLVFSREEKQLFTFLKDDDNLKLADFYTDVDALGTAVYHILNSIKKFGLNQSNFNISIEFLNDYENRFKCLKICHQNSKPTKILNRDFAGGDLLTIRKNLFGLCNWAIEASFENGTFRKYFLFDKSIPDNEIKLSAEGKGFTHLLIFY